MPTVRSIVILFLALAPLARADWKKDAQQCGKPEIEAEQRVRYCTSAIDSGHLSGKELGTALHNRGVAYTQTGDYDRAIPDFTQAIQLKPDQPQWFYDRGNAYIATSDYDHAVADFDQAIRLNPNYADAFLDRGRARGMQQKFDLAIADYNEAIRLAPNDALAFVNRALAYDNKGDQQRAMQEYDQAVRVDPRSGLAFRYRGQAYSNRQQYDRAIQDFNEAIRLDPKDADALDARADAFMQKDDYDAAIKDLDQSIQINPNFAQALSNRGFAWYRKGDLERALQDLDQSIQLASNDADAWMRRGIVYIDEGEYRAAVADLDSAINLRPDDANLLFTRGRAKFHQGDFTAAQSDLEKLASTEYPALWLYLARARAGQEARSDLARNAAKMDLSVWPGPVVNFYLGKVTAAAVLAAAKDADATKDREQHCEAYFYLGQQLLIAGKQSEANRLFEQALETKVVAFVEYAGAKAELAHFGKEAARRCHEDWKKDISAANTARDCSDAIDSRQLSGTELAKVYDYRGTHFSRKGDYDRAIQDFSQAINLQATVKPMTPDEALASLFQLPSTEDLGELLFSSSNVFANAFVWRGDAYKAKGNLDQAIADYGQAIQLDKNYANAFVARGAAHTAKGNLDLALQDYDEAVRMNPEGAGLFLWRHERGIVRFYLGQFSAAEEDFAATLKAIPFPDSVIWRYLARARSGAEDARAQLAKDATKANIKEWPGPVISFYLGKTLPPALLAAAKDTDPKKEREHQCQTYFYLGQHALLAGKEDEARRWFQQALDARFAGFREFIGAQAELKRLPVGGVRAGGQ